MILMSGFYFLGLIRVMSAIEVYGVIHFLTKLPHLRFSAVLEVTGFANANPLMCNELPAGKLQLCLLVKSPPLSSATRVYR